MESKDLKWIKKWYGEKFAHLCRELFPTLLEKEGLLTQLLSKHFPPSRELYNDLVSNDLIYSFKSYIYSLIPSDNVEMQKQVNLSPEELMDKAGYILYPECKTEEDIQSFRHYYYRGEPTPEYKGGKPVGYKGEELCTFNGGRLGTCRVWFAVRKDVDKIKREDFKNPRREDDYGTSVISIQYTKNKPSTLSIKNRYNHALEHVTPDATYGNNLDNIIEGLTSAFVKKFGIETDNVSKNFYMPEYVKTKDGVFYKPTLNRGLVQYCADNVVIERGQAKTLDKNRYLLIENFVLDLQDKKIFNYDKNTKDPFVESIGKIKEIKRFSRKEGMTILITPEEGEVVEINLNKKNQIVGYSNKNIKVIGDSFLKYNKTLMRLELPNVHTIGKSFLFSNKCIQYLNLPNVQIIDDDFLYFNETLMRLELPNVHTIGKNFLYKNNSILYLNLPNVQIIDDDFLYFNRILTHLELPNVQIIGNSFLFYNKDLVQFTVPNVEIIGCDFMRFNKSLTQLTIPKILQVGEGFMLGNKNIDFSFLNSKEV